MSFRKALTAKEKNSRPIETDDMETFSPPGSPSAENNENMDENEDDTRPTYTDNNEHDRTPPSAGIHTTTNANVDVDMYDHNTRPYTDNNEHDRTPPRSGILSTNVNVGIRSLKKKYKKKENSSINLEVEAKRNVVVDGKVCGSKLFFFIYLFFFIFYCS